MCGIVGFLGTELLAEESDQVLRAMARALRHRGPDDEGYWSDLDAQIGLGHRRLSIIDLSPQGHQPMQSASGRYVIVYNGEVYNFGELRRDEESRGTRLRGHSDTEVMLAVIERHGVLDGIRQFAGMFAFALWDRAERTLYLVRDRLGEKPLYYGWVGRTLLFGSELKAFRRHPQWRGDIDPAAVALFLRHNYIPSPYSIYHGIWKLPPGTIAAFRSVKGPVEPEVVRYWVARDVVESGLRHPLACPGEEVLAQLDSMLRRTIRQEMVADVPLGAFLSGGIDSSLVVALMQAESDRPIRTFTIGFHEAAWNEAKHARAVASHLGTDHTELYVTPEETLAVVPRLPAIYDEPFSDSSQVPTFLVAQLARHQVTVSLSGDGGDELFGGYARYGLGNRIWRAIGGIPVSLRAQVGRWLGTISPETWDRLLAPFRLLAPGGMRGRVTGDRLHKGVGLLTAQAFELMYRDLLSHWHGTGQVVPGGIEPITSLADPSSWLGDAHPLARMMYLDAVSYLPDDILVKVDRATMAVSLESRAPFLDHRIFELAWRIPLAAKVDGYQGKKILRRLLSRYVPEGLTDRPKMGFGVPIEAWLRGPLREWAAALLDERRLREAGILDPLAIRRKWNEHQAGTRNWQYLLWDVLMFEAWRREQH